jgi:hypothetical protein
LTIFVNFNEVKFKAIGTFKKISSATLILIALLLAAIYISAQMPGVQTFVTKLALKQLKGKIDGDISIGKAYYIFFDKLILTDVSIVSSDSTPHIDSLKKEFGYSDTLMTCGKVSIKFSIADLLAGKIKMRSVAITGGVFNLQQEDSLHNNLERIFRIEKTPTDTAKSKFSMSARSLTISDYRFRLKNYIKEEEQQRGDSILDFANLDVGDIKVDIKNIRIKNGTTTADVKSITGHDKCGAQIKKLKCNIIINGKKAEARNLVMTDGHSLLKAKSFSLNYDTPHDLADYVRKVKMIGIFDDTYFSFATLKRFSENLQDSRLGLYVTGRIAGTVDNLRSKDLEISTENGQTYLKVDLELSGLPDIKETIAYLDIKHGSTTTPDIAKTISEFSNMPEIKALNNLSHFVRYNMEGGFAGLLTDFVAHMNVSSNAGNFKTDILLKPEKGNVKVEGTFSSENLDVGKIIGNPQFGEVSMKTKFSSLLGGGLGNGGVTAEIEKLNISKLTFNDYPFSEIAGRGNYSNRHFDGRITCHDPNLDFIFQGLFSFDKKKTRNYDFYADVPYANLSAINVDRRDSSSVVSFRTNAKFIQDVNSDITGQINVYNASYSNTNGKYDIGTVKFISKQADSLFVSQLYAPFAIIKYEGTNTFSSFYHKTLSSLIYTKVPDILYRYASVKGNGEKLNEIRQHRDRYSLDIRTFNTQGICALLSPGLYIRDGSNVKISINRKNEFLMDLNSGRIAFNRNYIKDCRISAGTKGDTADIIMYSSEARALGINTGSAEMHMKAGMDKVHADISFREDSIKPLLSHMNADMAFNKDSILINTGSSFFSLNGEKWTVDPAEIVHTDSLNTISGLKISKGRQSIKLYGRISGSNEDSLHIRLRDFDISMLNSFTDKQFGFKGLFSGKGAVTSLWNRPSFLMDVTGDSVSVNGSPVGRLYLLSKWFEPDERFNILVYNVLNDSSNIRISGYYKPSESFLNLDASLDKLQTNYFAPFLSDIFSGFSGTLSGSLKLAGPLSSPVLTGNDCRMNNFGFTLDYTKVPYVLNGPFGINGSGISFNDISLSDGIHGAGKINGKLSYSNFRDLALDTYINFKNMECLKTGEGDNDSFYGSAFATGMVSIKGPLENLGLNIDVLTDNHTSIHIPLSSEATATRTNLLTFTRPESFNNIDPYDTLAMSGNTAAGEHGRIKVNLRTRINRSAEIMLEINKSLGDVIKAGGTGELNMKIDPSRDIFDIFGNYNIDEGNYKFVFSSFALASRNFSIEPGGTINFNGDIRNTTLNLTASYRTKAAINTLIADTSSVKTRRDVKCEIGLTGKLMNPNLNFKIEIPDLDPTTKVMVDNALNSQDKVQKQFAALLVSGGFLPNTESGITNNTTILYSNVSEILSNQLNNILQQLGIPLDLGLNYQQGEKGDNVFDVAVSTQMFNNRVIVNGNIGNDPYSESNNRSVIGNIDVQVKLDDKGRLRLTLFSHASDQFSNYLDVSQRNGLGITFQQEFDNFGQIFKSKAKLRRRIEKMLKKMAQKTN